MRRKLTLRTSVKQHLGDEAEQEVLEETSSEPEVGPVMTVLEALQSIALEVNLTIEVLLVEDLHGDLALAAVGSTVVLTVELQVVLDGAATVLGLLGLARRNGGRNGPEGHQNGDGGEESEEDGGIEPSTNLACQPPGHDDLQSNHQAIGEAIAAGGVGRNRSILDSWVLIIKYSKLATAFIKCSLRIAPHCALTKVVGTPQSKAGLVCSGAAGVWIYSNSSVESG